MIETPGCLLFIQLMLQTKLYSLKQEGCKVSRTQLILFIVILFLNYFKTTDCRIKKCF